ncbi:MAG: adenylate/guanylate cyclase domain-containing protein [Hyphomicrobiales bacterium]
MKAKTERRQAAVMAADVAGYSRLMAQDDERTLSMLVRYRRIFARTLSVHGGRLFGMAGDSVMSEFPNAKDAVAAAIAVQELISAENARIPKKHRMEFRIGIDAGVVISRGNDLFGDEVNVASRLQSIAESGGICITKNVYDGVRGEIDSTIVPLGRRQLKNIPRQVTVYRVDWQGRSKPEDSELETAARDRPTVAVLPFIEITPNSQSDYFLDGLVREIVSELCRFRSLLVLSATSSLHFRDSGSSPRRIGSDLGVKYLVDGTIERTSKEFRLSARLLEAESGLQVWGDKYRYDLDEPTKGQDWLVREVVSRLNASLEQAELQQTRRKPPQNLKSFDLWLQGAAQHEGSPDPNFKKAKKLYKLAIKADPAFSRPYASLAEIVYMESVLSNWGVASKDGTAQAAQLAQKAVDLDPLDASGHAVMAWVHMVRREFPRAERCWKLAESLNPNDADITMWRATALAFLGRPTEAISTVERAMRLNPMMPTWYLSDYAVILFFAQRFEEMQATYDLFTPFYPHTPAYRAAAFALQGQNVKAAEQADAFCNNIAKLWRGSATASPADYGSWFVKCLPIAGEAELLLLTRGLSRAGLYRS